MQEAAQAFLDFFEVAIHCILYTRQLYPKEAFERRRKYAVPVPYSKSALLNDYIQSILRDELAHWILKGLVEKVAVIILSADRQYIVERFLFEVTLIPPPPNIIKSKNNNNNKDDNKDKGKNKTNPKETDKTVNANNNNNNNTNNNNNKSSGPTFPDLPSVLRGFLLKITTCDTLLNPLPKDCTFSIVAYVNTLASNNPQQTKQAVLTSQNWIVADRSEGALPISGSTVHPLKSLSDPSAPLKLQLLVEEAVVTKTQIADGILTLRDHVSPLTQQQQQQQHLQHQKQEQIQPHDILNNDVLHHDDSDKSDDGNDDEEDEEEDEDSFLNVSMEV